jgi:hypothetical protein
MMRIGLMAAAIAAMVSSTDAAAKAAPTMTLDEFIAQPRGATEADSYSCKRFTFPDADGNEVRTPYIHNLTTTTATGYTNAYDWLAKAMGMGPSAAFATAQGTLTGATATTATNSGATFPTAGQGLAGQWVIVSANSSGAGSTVAGVIVSNTSTVLTVDQWWGGVSTAGAAGTTPSTTGQYIILPGQASAPWMGVTPTAITPATSDTTLSGELTTNGFARAVGTWAHTAAASTYTLVHLWTATGTETINAEAEFGACNPTGGGVMPFESLVPTPPALISGDTLQITSTISL